MDQRLYSAARSGPSFSRCGTITQRRNVIKIPLYTIRHGQIGGTEFAIYNLIRGLASVGADIRLFYGHENDLSPDFMQWAASDPHARLCRKWGLPGPKGVRFLQETLFQLVRGDQDWAIFPNYFRPPALPLAKGRSCVILHDIQYRQFPQYHSEKRRKWLDFYLPKMFVAADLVVLISHSELELVRQHFGEEAARKCVVVYNAIDFERFGAVRDMPRPTSLAGRYILSVCHHFPHKNVKTLLEAFTRLAGRDPSIELVLVGSASEANLAFVRDSMPDHIRNRVRITGFVTDLELGRYYAHASLFALPSLYEGFGMPAVEALGLGVPTLVSNAYSLPEVTLGYAGLIDDTLDPQAWALAMERALLSGERPGADVVAHIRRTYAPEQSARTLLAALQSCDMAA
ncbi:glycosyltransferase family 1 protein [Sphingomonas sp. BGYR3]|uniref:glycosyltransferase family 4 protein n=1 Tax=Sphingomonas sp. BGYR3 TaxID=2975483 RepID=UPI0021A38386|nr:glycosyltransferase family 1 protein [Sphingomonas sp. BGYR3]MDG5488547.1 glycosyltransferase family 1 protein [Sphingomonas sp. BGYR3]